MRKWRKTLKKTYVGKEDNTGRNGRKQDGWTENVQDKNTKKHWRKSNEGEGRQYRKKRKKTGWMDRKGLRQYKEKHKGKEMREDNIGRKGRK